MHTGKYVCLVCAMCVRPSCTCINVEIVCGMCICRRQVRVALGVRVVLNIKHISQQPILDFIGMTGFCVCVCVYCIPKRPASAETPTSKIPYVYARMHIGTELDDALSANNFFFLRLVLRVCVCVCISVGTDVCVFLFVNDCAIKVGKSEQSS